MSERTLVRQLDELDTSFANIVDRLRHDLAPKYLAQRDISLTHNPCLRNPSLHLLSFPFLCLRRSLISRDRLLLGGRVNLVILAVGATSGDSITAATRLERWPRNVRQFGGLAKVDHGLIMPPVGFAPGPRRARGRASVPAARLA